MSCPDCGHDHSINAPELFFAEIWESADHYGVTDAQVALVVVSVLETMHRRGPSAHTKSFSSCLRDLADAFEKMEKEAS